MFTGIIEEVGIIRDMRFISQGATIAVASKEIPADAKIGDSIAVNGVCLTATSVGAGSFACDVSAETLRRSNFQKAKPGTKVNLERALPVGGRLGGHYVLGHVDGVGQLASQIASGEGFVMSFHFPKELDRYIVFKGSIAINGISLTIASLESSSFSVAVIPHTFASTNLRELSVGDSVNLETDILGKYFERFFQLGLAPQEKSSSRLTSDYLKSQGF
ncbi:MAG: riboflavin synthase [Acidobacteria bacterium]|nr:riboflavin synthase [Acidobacteriota bacterium]